MLLLDTIKDQSVDIYGDKFKFQIVLPYTRLMGHQGAKAKLFSIDPN